MNGMRREAPARGGSSPRSASPDRPARLRFNRKQLRLIPVLAIAVVAPLGVGYATGQVGQPPAPAESPAPEPAAEPGPEQLPAEAPAPGTAPDAQVLAQGQAPSPSVDPTTAQTTTTTTRPNTPVPSGVRLDRVDWLSQNRVALWVESPAMGRAIQVQLLLPQSWNADKNATYPALYMLDGLRAVDTQSGWTAETQIAKFFDSKNALIVLPVGGESSFYADWQKPAKGTEAYQWETFLTKELPPIVQRDWRANDKAGVVGLSMGGTAAMNLAARNEGQYQFAASFSGYLDTTSFGMPEAIKAAQTDAGGYDSEDMWGPLGGQTWREHDPKLLVDKLKGVSLYVSAGSGNTGPWDAPSVIPGIPQNFPGYGLELLARMTTQNFVNAAKEKDIPVTAMFRPSGTHTWPYWQFEMTQAWPQAAAALGIDAAAPACETGGEIGRLVDSDPALGECLTGEYDIPRSGKAQDFRNGRVFWSPETGAHSVVGRIGAAYQAFGGPEGPLGLPRSSEQPTEDGVGRFNEFENGVIYWSPKTGAHVISGEIRELWLTSGKIGEKALGYPTGDPVKNPNNDVIWQNFQNGTVFKPKDGPAYWVKGAILAKYQELGAENDKVGVPTSNEIPLAGGAFTKFTNGAIYWSKDTGAHYVPYGKIFDAWGEEDYENGRLGYPTSDVKEIAGGGQEVEFENGTIRLVNGKIEK